MTKATTAHNHMMHEALMGNADPNEAYDGENKNLAFELREEAGNNGTTRRRGKDEPKESDGTGWVPHLYREGRCAAQKR